MNKQGILIIFLILILAVSIKMGLPGQSQESLGADEVCIKDRCFTVEIAANQSQREYGLMNREHLDPDRDAVCF